MADIKAKKCDICNYVYEPYEEDIEISVTFDGKVCRDLCPRCNHSLGDTIEYLTRPKREYTPKPEKREIISRYEFEKAR